MRLIYVAPNKLEANLIAHQLEQSDIQVLIEGEHLQGIELIDGGGFVKIKVAEEDFDQAKEIINDIELTRSQPEEKNKKNGIIDNFKFFFIGVLAGSLIVSFFYYLPLAQEKYDRNGDGKIDEKSTYIKYQISKTEFDRNFDGKMDFKYWFNNDGSPRKSVSDENFDGIFDTEATYKHGNIITSMSDTTNDGFKNYHVHYKNGVVDKIIFINPTTKNPSKIEYYDGFSIKKSELDIDGDGKFDIFYNYDHLGEIIK